MQTKRRELLLGSLSGGLLAGLPALATAQTRKHRIGHTGIAWGYQPQNAPQAINDVGILGYQGLELYGSTLEYWESRGGLGDLLAAAKLPLVAAYCPVVLTDGSKRKDEIAKLLYWGQLIKRYGGNIAVISPDIVDRSSFNFSASKSSIIDSLNAMGQALQGIGVTAALHPHTGSCIMTRDETYAVMEAVNTQYVKLCPDTGELFSAGIDPVQTVKDFLPVIAHVHLKDFDGSRKHDGYCPVGKGQVDIAGVLEVLESSTTDFMVMAELNPAPLMDGSVSGVLQLATSSKRKLAALGYVFN